MENISTKSHAHSILKFSIKNQRKILKAFLLSNLHQIFCDLFNKQSYQDYFFMEYYAMDTKIIQLLIQNILDTQEYTLEGIAYYTHVPFDVIYDAACGINNQFSITPWVRVVDLYLKVKPDITQVLIDKLLELKKQRVGGFSSLLCEM